MQDHPIPQNVTPFEFKLIGPMTVKQFGFLLAGVIPAVLIYLIPLIGFFKWPLMFIVGGLGIALAFLPVNGRPLDKWLMAFIRAITSPTRRVWLKENHPPYYLEVSFKSTYKAIVNTPYQVSRQKLEAYLRTIEPSRNRLDVAEEQFVARLDFTTDVPENPIAATPVAIPSSSPTRIAPATLRQYSLPAIEKRYPAPAAPVKPKEEIEPITRLASEFNNSSEPVIAVPTFGRTVHLFHGVGQTRVRRLGRANLPIAGEKKFELSEELKKRFGVVDSAPKLTYATPTAPLITHTLDVATTKVENIPPQTQPEIKKSEVAPSQPADRRVEGRLKPTNQPLNIPMMSSTKTNTLVGVVVDQTGAPVPAAVVLVKDSAGVPVRAFKTSNFGQFFSATPLPDGHYQLDAEKEGYVFSETGVDLKGDVVDPVKITSKQA